VEVEEREKGKKEEVREGRWKIDKFPIAESCALPSMHIVI